MIILSKSKELGLLELLNQNLIIPSYQRPYEWEKSNVYILLDDIYSNYEKGDNINLGTIILNKKDINYEIVDGQQRLVTLSLLIKILDEKINIKLLDEKIFCFSNTENKIIQNYKAIREFMNRLINLEQLDINKFKNYIMKSILFYVLETKNSDEAFQLFDGRNSKIILKIKKVNC